MNGISRYMLTLVKCSNVPIINQHLPAKGIPSMHAETQTEACSI